MNEDALAAIASTQQDLAPVMRRLGEYELFDEDYQQLHTWARDFTENQYAITALELARNLDANSVQDLPSIECGRIKIANFAFISSAYGIEWLDLTNVPKLTVLGCTGGGLTKLELSHVPALTDLFC